MEEDTTSSAGIAPEKPDPIQVQVKELLKLHFELTEAAVRTGIDRNNAATLVAEHVSARCMQCHLILTGGDLAHLAGGDAEALEKNPKLARIAQGYCGRNGCDSYYYAVDFSFHVNLGWTRILEERSNPSDKPIPEEVYLTRSDRLKERLRSVDKRWWLGLILLSALLLLKSFEWREVVGKFRESPFTADTNSPSFQSPYR